MSSKSYYSKKIIRILGGKSAVPVREITDKINPSLPPLIKGGEMQNPPDKGEKGGYKVNYAITRSLKGLQEAGLVESISSGQNDYARLTKEGKKKMHSLKLENDSALVNTNWDGFWRIILLDLPESRKNERESLRYLLKKAGFVALKNSAWASPYPFEYLFINIKKDLGLTTELMIIVTQFVDEETKKVLLENFEM